MSLCNTCHYAPWDSRNPISEQGFLERLDSAEIAPTDKGPEKICLGSPFRTPLPLMIEMCCIDRQICQKNSIDFLTLQNKDEAEVAINGARVALYREVGLPSIG